MLLWSILKPYPLWSVVSFDQLNVKHDQPQMYQHILHVFYSDDLEKRQKVNTVFHLVNQWNAEIYDNFSCSLFHSVAFIHICLQQDILANLTWTSPFNIHSKTHFQEGLSVYKSDACPTIMQNDHGPPALMTFRNDSIGPRTHAKVLGCVYPRTHAHTRACARTQLRLPHPLLPEKWSLLIICWLPVRSP